MDFKKLKLTQLESNKGQIEGVPANPRQIRAERLELLSQNLTELPDLIQARPLIVSPLGDRFIIICGNMRFEAAKKLKYKEIDCAVLPVDTSAKKLRHIATVDNVGFGEWEWDILANEWNEAELKEWGVELPNLQSEVLEAEDDNYEEPENMQVDVVLGDLIEIGEHRLLCGDSTDTEQVARLMNGYKADMVFTDPPYGINEKGDRSKRCGAVKGNKLPDFKDDTIQYAIDAFNQPINNSIPVQVWFGANYYCHALPLTPNWLVWDKRVEDSQRDYNSDCELAWIKSKYSSIRIFRHLWKGMLKDSERGEKRVHATQKPLALVDFCIKEYSPDSKIIIDYFGGGGVCMAACHILKKVCCTMEIEPHNCQVIIDRMQKLDPNLEVKINGKPYKKEVAF